MSDNKRLAFSIIQFLHEQVRSGDLSSVAQESMEGESSKQTWLNVVRRRATINAPVFLEFVSSCVSVGSNEQLLSSVWRQRLRFPLTIRASLSPCRYQRSSPLPPPRYEQIHTRAEGALWLRALQPWDRSSEPRAFLYCYCTVLRNSCVCVCVHMFSFSPRAC